MTQTQTPTMWNERQAAARLGLSVAAMRNFRNRGTGPSYHKFGAAVRYSPDDIEAYISQARRDHREVEA